MELLRCLGENEIEQVIDRRGEWGRVAGDFL